MTLNNSDLDKLRHTCSHVLAAAVLELWPETKFGIGPIIKDGFYYDFDLPRSLKPEDLPKIEKKMREIIKQNLPLEKVQVDPAKAVKINKEAKQIYKLELIDELMKESQEITLYTCGQFCDLCKGPHLESTGQIKPDAFKLLSIAGAYWRGSETRPMLQRIYGTAWEKKEDLDKYLKNIKEAESRDHRKIGRELDLFTFSDLVGKGLPLLTSRGATIRRELERFTVDTELKWGYQHVMTPHLAKTDLYKKSGHYPYYKNTMYPLMKVDEEELILRPMSCPHHFMLYQDKPRSYRELPIRYAELASQFRYEKSGELTGLMRVRTFCLADAHIFCAPEQTEEEITNALKLIDFVNKTLGLKKGKDYSYRLSLGNRQDNKKVYKDDKAWDFAENILRQVLTKTKSPFYEAIGEAAFYGPKIDVQMKRINGQEDTAFTVQYDFVLPKRFNLKFKDNQGKDREPVVIHRSSIGCLERTMAFLIEYYSGNFPLWLSPVQVQIIPVGSKHIKPCHKLGDELKEEGFRVLVDDLNETVGNKIRKAIQQKVPYMLVIGDKEMKQAKLAVRSRGQKEVKNIAKKSFIKQMKEEIEKKIIK